MHGYDAWGKVLSTTGTLASTLGMVQPFRYRGYVYDVETGLYYLRSRYYDPEWGRFINADSLIIANLFVYCCNNPVVCNDTSGSIPKKLTSPNPKILASELVQSICNLEKRNITRYVHGGSNEKASDCIGLILQFVYSFYSGKIYTKNGSKYDHQVNINGDIITIGTYVENAVRCNAMLLTEDDKILSIPKNDSNALEQLLPGTLVITSDYSHIGIYVGKYTNREGVTIEHCVIECTKKKTKEVCLDGVYASDISASRFDYYCMFNYIEYDVDYLDTVYGLGNFVVR